MQYPAIVVEKLCKRYKIHTSQRQSFSMGRTLLDAIKDPLKRFMNSAGYHAPGGSKSFWALKDVSFNVQRGEVVGIIGRNGCGKSTLLKILSRVVEPTSGRAIVNGRVGSLLEIGMGFHPELTGRENIYLSGAVLGMKRNEIDGRFDEIVEFSGVGAFVDTPVKRYSSGMYVRLAFAVAAQMEPEVLIIDEVLAVGDQAFQKKCVKRMETLAHEGRTVLFVSHSMESIRSLCHTAILLDQGGLAMHGPSNEVVDTYLNLVDDEADAGDKAEHPNDIGRIIARLPEDSVFKLKDLAILQDGLAALEVSSARPVNLMIDYEVLEECQGLYVFFRLYSNSGILVFESLHNGSEADLPVVTPGNYTSVAEIPADFLTPTSYEIWVGAAVHNVRSCLPDMIRLPLFVRQAGNAQRAYPNRRLKGEIAPLITWTTKQQDIDKYSNSRETELNPPSPVVCWEDPSQAPGNDTIRLRCISVRDKEGSIAGKIDAQSAVSVEIEYWSKTRAPEPYASILIQNGANESILQSSNFNGDGPSDNLLPKGLYKTTCSIAENLLSPGRFCIAVNISTNTDTEIVRINEALTIDVFEASELSNKDVVDEAPDVIHPLLPWRIEALEEGPVPERVWEDLSTAPGNVYFGLHGIKIKDTHGIVLNDIPVSAGFSVEVEYFNWISDLDLLTAIVLHQPNGESSVLYANDVDHDWGGCPKPCSKHRLTCDVPGGTLAMGRLSVSVLMWCAQEYHSLALGEIVSVNVGPQVIDSHKFDPPVRWRYERPGWPPVAEQTWDDPASGANDNRFGIRGMRVRAKSGEVSASITPGEEFHVEIDTCNFQQIASLEISLCIMDWYNNCLVRCFNNWNKALHDKPIHKGLYRSACTIPGSMLAPGRYYITAQVIDSDYDCTIDTPDPVSIDIHDEDDCACTTSPTGLPEYPVQPNLPWETETLLENPAIAPNVY